MLKTSLHLAPGENLQRMGVHAGEEILAGGIGIGIVEKVGILANLGLTAVVGIHPVDGSTLDLAAVPLTLRPSAGLPP